jgi:hypothetical protein
MAEMISICGLKCHTCDAFIATRDDDDAKRAATAEVWSKMYNAELKPEAINCSGCLSEGGVLFQHCTVCEIRKCGKGRGVLNCAHCDDYACDKLTEFFKMVPDAKETLDTIRATLR